MTIQDSINTIKIQLKNLYAKEEIFSLTYIILENLLNYSKTELLIRNDEVLDATAEKELYSILEKLKSNQPIQYILGETEFFGLKYKVTPEVLIPRQETEELISWIIMDNVNISSEFNILDIGTGSGCIAISLAKFIKKSKVSAIDYLDSIIEIANENANQNKVNIDFINQNILKKSFIDKKFDIIVSNPPYIRNWEKESMSKNVLNYEPKTALFVPDKDPLIFYRAISIFCKTHLKKNGKLYLEINEGLGEETKKLLSENNFTSIEIRNDINKKPRMIKAIYEG